jgi:phage/plasmid-associated DNA primase
MPFAKLIFSANLPPLPPEGIQDEDAFYKRWFVVSFNLRKTNLFFNRTKKENNNNEKKGAIIEIDRELISKLTTDEELSGLFYLAIKAAQRLLANGRFTKWPNIETITKEYEKKADPVKAWVFANCALSPEYETEKETLEADFDEYCESRKLPILNRVHLGRELNKLPNVRDGKTGPKTNRKPVWKGIALRKDLRKSGQLGLGDDNDDLFSQGGCATHGGPKAKISLF